MTEDVLPVYLFNNAIPMRGNYSSREEHDQVEAIFRDRRRRQARERFRTVTNVVATVASAIFVLAFYGSLIAIAIRRLVR